MLLVYFMVLTVIIALEVVRTLFVLVDFDELINIVMQKMSWFVEVKLKV